ncbi:hypothetical protein DFH07DRAFT_993187 [Mycena maculata]|uniref:Uncharacterized protein n=1 Tax=Mycena maculata TaxID=230809 RepID=A0AAD7JVC3_9AGAR|nr:hypothetical protein DFH07DRAFT_993187 [Mycena maculata]
MDIPSFSVNFASFPGVVWNFYVQYLWNWTDYPNSWISRIAWSARVLAILLVLPVVILTLLDIASYGIARTLGVIDDVKASTSDKNTIHNQTPLIHVSGSPSPNSVSLATDSETLLGHADSSTDTLPPLSTPSGSHPRTYFTSEEHSLKLSGVGVFSPAVSRPPSPAITRRNFIEEKISDVDEGITIRKRGKANTLHDER